MQTAGKTVIWLAAAVVLAAMVFMILRSQPAADLSTSSQPATFRGSRETKAAPSVMKKTLRPSQDAASAALPNPEASPYAVGSPQNAEWLDEKKEELNNLAWFDDKESLDRLLAEMRNPQAEIREAALRGVVSFGSKDAIPQLEILARGTSDVNEQKAIRDAIEYLSLPTMTEYLEENSEDPPDASPP